MSLKALILAAVVSIGLGAGAQAGFVKMEASGTFTSSTITNPADHPNFDSNADWSLSLQYDMDALAEIIVTTDLFRIAAAVQNLDLRLNDVPVSIAPDGPSTVSYVRLNGSGVLGQIFQVVLSLDLGDPILSGSIADRVIFQLNVFDTLPLSPLFTNNLDLGSVDLNVANAPDKTEANVTFYSDQGIVQSSDYNRAAAVFTEVPAPLPLAMMLAGIGAIALRRLG